MRKQIRQLLGQLSDRQITESSASVSRHLIECLKPGAEFERAEVIALYAAIGSELNLKDVASWAQAAGKVIALPVLEPAGGSVLEPAGSNRPAGSNQPPGDSDFAAAKPVAGYDMSLRTWEAGAAFRLGPFRIPEPTGGARLDFEECDLVMTPGLAFSRKGERLGRGKGYYDRALAFLGGAQRPAKVVAIGICHEFQLLDRVPVLSTDILMDAVATPAGISCLTGCSCCPPTF